MVYWKGVQYSALGERRGVMTADRWLVIQVAGMGAGDLRRPPDRLHLPGASFGAVETVFPALTCTAQASFRTGLGPDETGVWANGFYARALARPLFWEQHAGLVAGPRIWDAARAAGRRVGMLFWQQSLGESVDLLLSPRPVHRHHGGLVQDCLDRPAGLYARLCAELGGGFPLHRYWGPLAGLASTRWITDATRAILAAPDLAPDLLFTYLPHLDYAFQRHGPGSAPAVQALDELAPELSKLWSEARARGYQVLVFGDYTLAPVTAPPVHPLSALRAADLFATHAVRGRLYPDFFHSAAVALCDHEVAPVYARDAAAARAARRALEATPGVGEIVETPATRPADAPDFVAVAEPGRWFAYPWWDRPAEAPDYAGHVDIHNKPGYDPCELFWGWPPPAVSQNPARVRGTHGRAGPDRAVAWAATAPDVFDGAASLPDLARALARALTPGRGAGGGA